MNALPTSVWQTYKRMPVKSNYEVRGVDKWCLVVEENGRQIGHYTIYIYTILYILYCYSI